MITKIKLRLRGVGFAGVVAMAMGLSVANVQAALPPPPAGPPAPILTGILLSGPATVNEETTAQYVCTGKYSDGTTSPISATWSENSAYASINSSGLLSAANVATDQNVTITATYGGYSASLDAVIRYVAPVLSGITITGPTSVNEETTAQYSCTASYSDGTSATVTPTWSENSSYATISGSGLLTAGNVASDQNVTITASFGGQSDTHAVSIKYVAPTLASITISGPVSINEQTTAQYACTASYSDGTSATVIPTWSENSSYATISTSGLLSAGNVTSDQGATITATFGGKSDTHAITIKYVAPTLASIAIAGPAVVNEGSSAQYTCTASYSDGTSATVTPTWSENSSYATISGSGLLTAGNVTSDQSATITATFGGKSASKMVTLHDLVTLSGIAISGATTVAENSTVQFICTATYSDGTTATVNPTWSENSDYASITAAGLLTAQNIEVDQTLTVTASFEGKTASQPLTILMEGSQVVYPLTGFAGKTVMAELWDETAQTWRDLGQAVGPGELVIEDMVPGQWYWLRIKEYDVNSSTWVKVQSNWICM